MSSEVFNLAILLSLKDAASGGLDRFSAKLRTADKEGKKFAESLEDIREEMNKGFTLGAIGGGALVMMSKGVQVAANFQSSMTDLRSSFSQLNQDGKVDLNSLGKDMLRAEAIAIRLGNALPGTSEQVIQTIQKLKENGLQTETILNGAADAVYNLAVANNELSTDTAKNFAQFGQLFKLRPDEYVKAADVFSRLYTSSGIGSSELIEGLKYFQGRAGASLGLSGLDDAEKAVRLMGLMKKQGLEGSLAGTALNNLFSGYLTNGKAITALEKSEGIKLNFFDEKGNFAGIDNLFKQLEPLQKLSEEKRASYLKNIFGEEGMSAATAILKTGADGWRSFNDEQNKTISLQQKNAEKAKDFNNQMEALTGTMKNLVVTTFEPLLPSVTSGVESLNSMVSVIQGFGKENPNLVKTLGTLALYGSTSLIVVGGFKAMANAWKLFTMVSRASRGEGILGYLTQTATAADTVTNRVAGFSRPLDAATEKTKGFRGVWQGIASSPALKLGVQVIGVAAAEIAITALIEKYKDAVTEAENLNKNTKDLTKMYDSLMGQWLLYNAPGDYKGQKGQFDAIAEQFLNSARMDKQLYLAFHPDKATMWERWNFSQPYGVDLSNPFFNRDFKPEHAAATWREAGITAPLQDPNVLARVIANIQRGGGDLELNQGNIKLFIEALERVTNKEKVNTALEILDKERGVQNVPLVQPKTFNEMFPPFTSSRFFSLSANPFKNPFEKKPAYEPKPMIDLNRFDPNKPPMQFFTPIQKLNQPLDWGNLNQPINTFTTSLQNSSTTLSISFAELSKQAMEQSKNTETALKIQQNLTSLQDILTPTTNNIGSLGDTSKEAFPNVKNLGTSANNTGVSLNLLSNKLSAWQPPTIQMPTYQQQSGFQRPQSLSGIGSFAVGGSVKSDGLAYIHTGEDIVPAKVARGYREKSSSSTNSINITFSPNINVVGGDKNTAKQIKDALRLFAENGEMERIFVRMMKRGRERV